MPTEPRATESAELVASGGVAESARAAPPPSTLPAETSSFVGRKRELAEARKLLSEARLLTLTGAGGCGKTRLALRVAREVSGNFADGTWWVELASLSEPGLVPQAMARALGIHEALGRTLLEILAEYLGPKEALLVLDNCEHLVDACAQLADALLRSCPRVKILATSREALSVAGEAVFPVPSLSLPGPARSPGLEELERSEAARLFVARARAVAPGFEPTGRNAAAVAGVCRALDGIPLAIELAAARARVLSPEQILDRLDDRFGLLGRGSRTAPPRQRTLRATIDWSYGLLSDAEQALFRRLSVFSGGFTLGAAEEVCSGEGVEEDEVLDLLSRLVDKSLVSVEQGGEEARYRLLETVRQYGWERLSESGEAKGIQRRHAAFYLELAESAGPVIMGPGQATWVERLEREHDNLRAALGWLREEGEVEQGLRLSGALGGFWWFRGYFSEGRAQLEELLELAGGSLGSTAVRAKALHTLGVLIYRGADYSVGDQEAARSRLQESVEVYRELGDRSHTAAVLSELGYLSAEAGDWETARFSLDESLGIERQSGNEYGIALTRTYLGIMAVLRGEHGSARTHLEESLSVLRRLGELQEVKVCLFYLGLLACDEGDYGTARARIAEQVEDAPLQLYRFALPWVLQGYARLAAGEGRPAHALRLAGAAAALHRALGQSVGPACKAYFRRGLELAWRALSEQEGKAAFEEGQAMSFEQALAHILEDFRQEGARHADRVAQEATEADPAGLSARELEVLKLVAEGLTDPQIAGRLHLSRRTVGWHLGSIYRKLEVPPGRRPSVRPPSSGSSDRR